MSSLTAGHQHYCHLSEHTRPQIKSSDPIKFTFILIINILKFHTKTVSVVVVRQTDRQTDVQSKQQISFRATCWALQQVLVRNTLSTEIILVYRVRTFCDLPKSNYIRPRPQTAQEEGLKIQTYIHIQYALGRMSHNLGEYYLG